MLKRAKELGDHLTVCVSSDEFNAEKGKRAYTSYEDRKYILEAIRYVDEVIPETTWDQKKSKTFRSTTLTPLSWVMTGRASLTSLKSTVKSFTSLGQRASQPLRSRRTWV
ncbi:adenylyltransferase/cytidyltransferase family protein [Secundilactobacillus oryzae]|uniref:adenylyltransferase/cytidyltransferase family protein n=1 Tax=Secundilactobacillus oryzae TaxID=1202668 RepID=UPI000AC2A3A9|nr:adenylyltransferase/cytidyltransferase family protein [Secundilactobacillus oryzae]